MKRIKFILPAFASLCLLAACTINNVDPLEGVYNYDRYSFTSGTEVGDPQDNGDYILLNVAISDGSNSMNISFGSSSYVLPAATYSAAAAITGSKQYTASINGTSVTDGDIDVVLSGDTYYFSAFMTDAGGREFVLSFKGSIEFDDPTGGAAPTYTLTTVLYTQINDGSVTLNIATDGVSYYYDDATWSNVYEGNGGYLAVDFYSTDGYLYPGTYTPGSDPLSSGQFQIGWDPGDLYGWGILFTDWGTCWWTVDNGSTSAEHITDGTIEVSLDGDTYTITLESSVVNAVYTGPIDDLNPNK
ncbi:MAG: hypothetical protein LUC24_00265 [Bacteroidales bacterium]|nr:hypothetical protein [Bacteroidales bacterium]